MAEGVGTYLAVSYTHLDVYKRQGKESVERECKKQNIDPAQIAESDAVLELCKRFNCATIEDLFAGIGSGDIRVETVVTKMRDEFHKVDAPSLPDITPRCVEETGPLAL